MDTRRLTLYFVFALVVTMLWGEWRGEHQKQETNQNTGGKKTTEEYTPAFLSAIVKNDRKTVTHGEVESVARNEKTKSIHIETDVLDVTVGTKGGTLLSTRLKDYPTSLTVKAPFVLLNDKADTKYIGQSDLVGFEDAEAKQGLIPYSEKQTNYQLQKGQHELRVPLTWTSRSGILVTKTFIFKRGDYVIGVEYAIKNQTADPWTGHVYAQLDRRWVDEGNHSFLRSYFGFFGVAISTPEKPYEKISFEKLAKQNISQETKGGWVAMTEHYFLSAWIPERSLNNHYFSRADTQNNNYTIGFVGPPLTADSGEVVKAVLEFYSGPKITENLKKIAPGLDLTIDYGWLWFLSHWLFVLLKWLYRLFGNWGWSIIMVTVAIKLLFYRLSEKSYRSMARMRNLQPKMVAIRERYVNDKVALSQATMDLYRKEKINPLGGCLPMLIQIPVFIALYWVLMESVELRQAPFMLWINDLSEKDPYYVLPILMGGTMVLQQKMSPPPPDPIQAKVMMFLPVVFTVLFLNFPAGLVLYWVINNSLSMLQQWYITRKIVHDPSEKR